MSRLKTIFLCILLIALTGKGQAQTLTVDDFIGEPELLDMDISPNGHYLAEIRQNNGTYQVYIRDLTASGSIIGTIGGSTNRPHRAIWANDERLIVHMKVPYFSSQTKQKLEEDPDFDMKSRPKYNRFVSVDIKGNNPVLLMQHLGKSRKQLGFYGYEYPRLEQEKLATPIITNYRTRDGATVRMYLLLPPRYQANEQYPLVVMPHGGPHTRDYAIYDNFAAFIATRGYIVARPNFRGSTGYGLKFEAAGHRQWGGIMQDDLQDAAQHLIDKNYAIAGRICLVGGSYGGYAALMGLVKHSGFYRCAASINGVTHLRDQIKHNENRFKDYPEIVASLHKRIGNPKTDSSQLDHNSPALQANKIAAPVLIIAGTKDGVVPYKQSKRMVAALKSKKKEVEWLSLKDAYHNPFFLDKDKRAIYSRIDAFLAKHLQQPETIP